MWWEDFCVSQEGTSSDKVSDESATSKVNLLTVYRCTVYAFIDELSYKYVFEDKLNPCLKFFRIEWSNLLSAYV
jgi:hypothetical protein